MTRVTEHAIEPIILDRWSPRAFLDDALAPEALHQMLEAARWAPSGNNLQPWRFLYSLRGDAHWKRFAALPNTRNRRWCDRAAGLVLVLSGGTSSTHSFDAGCAWGYLALQASAMGWATHAMAGFDHEAARDALKIPQDMHMHALIAIGRPGLASSLPDDLRERERPSDRKPLADIARAGNYDFPLISS